MLKELFEKMRPNSIYGVRMFNRVRINDNIELSIQASRSHYCSPRLILPINKYESVELAIFRDNNFVPVEDVTQNKELIDELNDYYEGMVYGFVPIELAVKLYQDIINQ